MNMYKKRLTTNDKKYELKVFPADENDKYGYYVFYKGVEEDETAWRQASIFKCADRKYVQVRTKWGEGGILMGYLHQIIFAYYCNWSKMSTKFDENNRAFHIHHISKGEPIESNFPLFNNPFNMVYLSPSDHRKIEIYLNKISEGTASDEEQDEYNAIVGTAAVLRDRAMKKIMSEESFEARKARFEEAIDELYKK